MTTFKVGDNARVMDASLLHIPKGTIGEVVGHERLRTLKTLKGGEVVTYGLCIRWPDGRMDGPWREERFERVAEHEATNPPDSTLKGGRNDPRKPEGGSRGEALANGDRMQEYGHPRVSFERIAALWSAYLSAPEIDPENLSAEDVGHMQNLLKISRSITDKKADTLDDIEGYVACIRMLRDDA